MDFADLIAPMSADAFAEHLGKRPVHIANREAPFAFTRARFEALLDHATHWTDRTLKLVYNAMPMPREQFCLPENGVLRPHIGRVREFLAHGVSLVGDNVGAIAPELAEVEKALNDALGKGGWANVYLSFQNIGAFGAHYDVTDVLAFHCEGEKLWRIYEGRAATPDAFPAGGEDAVRAHFRREAGAVEQEIRMRPGDALYIPKGVYHDALAQSPHSLHVTFALRP